jgi:hypothetical protein
MVRGFLRARRFHLVVEILGKMMKAMLPETAKGMAVMIALGSLMAWAEVSASVVFVALPPEALVLSSGCE